MPSHLVARVFNRITLVPTVIIAVSFGLSCFHWPCLCENSAASGFSDMNWSPRLLAHSMLVAAYILIIDKTWVISLPVANEPRSSTKDSDKFSDK